MTRYISLGGKIYGFVQFISIPLYLHQFIFKCVTLYNDYEFDIFESSNTTIIKRLTKYSHTLELKRHLICQNEI